MKNEFDKIYWINIDIFIIDYVQWDWNMMSKTMNDQYFINSYDIYYPKLGILTRIFSFYLMLLSLKIHDFSCEIIYKKYTYMYRT